MNTLETAIPFMKQLEKLLTEKKDNLNAGLKRVDIRGVDLDTPILRIQEQILSAETKYTIAFVGTFNTGKSTIINSLLNLQGNARLSSEPDPDTAKCIRLMKKERHQQYDAEVIFQETYSSEKMSWQEVKKYTSQVAMNDRSSDASIAKKAEKIEEIRYYIDNPFLDVCNILDLPGTGTGAYSEHTELTDRKIMEADCIFWVVSTDGEPDCQSISNLKKISTKMLPIINVWQCESKNISSLMQPEEIKNTLLTEFGTYFADAADPIFYYAGEIDLAQQENRELKPEWGKEEFTEKVQAILSNIQSGDRMKRIKKQIAIALSTCEEAIKGVLEDQELVALGQAEKNESHDIQQIRTKLRKASDLARGDIKDHAKKATQEILEIFSDASEAFIENQMQGTNWKALVRRRSFQNDLKRDFEKNYVKLNDGWLNNTVREFSDDVISILQGIYSDFIMDIESGVNVGNTFSMKEDSLSGFIEDMTGIMSKDMAERITPTIVATIAGGIMMLIPGGLVFEALVTLVLAGISSASKFTKDDKLRSKINGIKSTAKVQIRQQRATLVTSFSEAGKNVNNEFFKRISEELDSRSQANEQKKAQLRQLEENIKDMIRFIEEQSEELAKI